MRWLIDSDILIEGVRENPAVLPWLESQEEVATADIVRAEFLLGVYAIVTMLAGQMRPLNRRDLAHTRELAPA